MTDTDFDDLDALLDAATPAQEDVQICLDGARRREWNELVTAAMQPDTEGDPERRFGSKSTAASARERLEVLAAELRSRLLTIRVTAMPGTQWSALKAQHKPREGNAQDQAMGFNIEAVARKALLTHGHRLRGDEVSAISAGQWSKILDKIGGGDLQTLVFTVVGVNQLVGQQFVGQLVKGSPATSNSAGK